MPGSGLGPAAQRRRPAKSSGHNVVIYHAPHADGCELECGVQVAGEFAATGSVNCSRSPAGRAAHTVHWGAYHELGKAHDALIEYARNHGLGPGVHWDVYGDWEADEAKQRTDVYRLIAQPDSI